MTEDKASALRKVIINLIPEEYAGKPIPDGVITQIDISDKLEDGKYYCLDSIEAEYETHNNRIGYVPFEDYNQFKTAVETILDATIVNAKQRESAQKLLNRAFYAGPKFASVI